MEPEGLKVDEYTGNKHGLQPMAERNSGLCAAGSGEPLESSEWRSSMSWDFQNIGHVGRREAGALMSSHSSETGLGRPRLDSTRTLEKGASRSFGFLVGL